MIAAWLQQSKKLIAPYVFYGYTDARLFNIWLAQCLILELTPGQVVVMDNAAFHKSKRTKELIEGAGCTLLFQPAYSPDLNPIEKQWAIIKRKFAKYKDNFDNFDDAVNYAFKV